jgi:hypothetical protein
LIHIFLSFKRDPIASTLGFVLKNAYPVEHYENKETPISLNEKRGFNFAYSMLSPQLKVMGVQAGGC